MIGGSTRYGLKVKIDQGPFFGVLAKLKKQLVHIKPRKSHQNSLNDILGGLSLCTPLIICHIQILQYAKVDMDDGIGPAV